jgi:DNA-directed RNA polymerase specialized sigma24 family protein
MAESSTTTIAGKASWSLSERAFQKFLIWLDDGTPTDGRRYLEIRDRLSYYFERKNCFTPDDLADETLNRVARRLEEEGEIRTETPAKYCYTVARFVFLEYLRSNDLKNVSLDDAPGAHTSADPRRTPEPDESELRETMLNCLEKCIKTLDGPARDLIVRYYHGDQRRKIENRSALADALKISQNALAIRACRIREKLESCVGECAGRNVS